MNGRHKSVYRYFFGFAINVVFFYSLLGKARLKAGLVRIDILWISFGRDIAGSQGESRAVPLYPRTKPHHHPL